jgi:hypothetical protein
MRAHAALGGIVGWGSGNTQVSACLPGAGMLRTGGVRTGQRLYMPAAQVPGMLAAFCRELPGLLRRADLSLEAKAAWVMVEFLEIHPFRDGNGRLSRLLMNWVLRRGGSGGGGSSSGAGAAGSGSGSGGEAWSGLPFDICVCSSHQLRELLMGALKSRNVGRVTGVIAVGVERAWRAFELVCAEREASAAADTDGAAVRRWREDARSRGACVVCLDDGPEIATLCCGSAFHLRCLGRWVSGGGGGDRACCPSCRNPMEPEPAPPRQPDPAPAAGGGGAGRIPGLAELLANINAPHRLDSSDSESTTSDTEDLNTLNTQEQSATESTTEAVQDGAAEGPESDSSTESTTELVQGGAAQEDDSESTTESTTEAVVQDVPASPAQDGSETTDSTTDTVQNGAFQDASDTESTTDSTAVDDLCRDASCRNKFKIGCVRAMCGLHCRRMGGGCAAHSN